MKFLKPLSIIFACTFAGELMRYTIPLPVPANIYGLLLLFLLLVTKIVPLSSVETTGNFLIDFMPVMFILRESESSPAGSHFHLYSYLILRFL